MAVETPAYLRIAAELRDRIESGELGAHAMIPSERELSRTFEVSRMTARQAVAVLESEGAVYRRPPRGTFVAEPRMALRIGSFSDEMVRLGREPGAEVLWAETRTATPRVAQALGLGDGERVHALQRLRRADGEPLAIETTYLPADLAPDLLDHPLDGSLWGLVEERYGVAAARAEATVEVIALAGGVSRLLGVRVSAPGMLLTRRTYDAQGRCFEFARDVYRADRTAFRLDTAVGR